MERDPQPALFSVWKRLGRYRESLLGIAVGTATVVGYVVCLKLL